MKRLFQVRRQGELYYFDNKMKAKAFRDGEDDICFVSKGPDHIGNHGGNPKSKRKRSNSSIWENT